MKSLVLTVVLLGCALAEEAPYPPSGTRPQGALLVLPSETGSASASQPAAQYSAPQYLVPQPKPEEAENIQNANEKIVERIRQEQGSGSGSYYVYLPDGSLQRVQYSAAPLLQHGNKERVNLQDAQKPSRPQFNPQNAEASAKLESYTQEQSQSQRLQYLQPYSNSQYQPNFNNQYQQAASSQYKPLQTSGQYKQKSVSSQYRQQPSANQYNEEAASNQYSQQVPSDSQRQQQAKPEKTTQQQYQNFGQQADNFQQVGQYSKVSVQGASSNENSAFIQQQQLYQLQQQNHLPLQQYLPQPFAANYIANVQFTEVQPIATPVYSYTPAPLVRILRYAPMYE